MLYQEFTSRTNFYPDINLFEAIHREYVEHNDWDKDRFCEAYAANEDGIAEKIQRDADQMAAQNDADLRNLVFQSNQELLKLQAQVQELEKDLEREQGWKEARCNYRPHEGSSDFLTDDEAKSWLAKYLKNINVELIEIVHYTKIWKKDRHGNIKDTKMKQCVSPWGAYIEGEDENYYWVKEEASIPFRIAGQEYVLNVDNIHATVEPLVDLLGLDMKVGI